MFPSISLFLSILAGSSTMQRGRTLLQLTFGELYTVSEIEKTNKLTA